jgi:N-acyl-D-aspartate/D-glutamate deacylase
MLRKIGLLSVLVFAFIAPACQAPPDFDLLITGGRIVDGTGNPWFYGDVGIVGDRIEAVGDLTGKTAKQTIDAEGLVVSPGFIDLHTHCDRGLSQPESKANLNYLIQGTTTVVTGNCGGGSYNVADLKALWEGQGIGTNAVHLAGMGTVRESVMGEEPRKPTPEELDAMRELVRQAMREGAWGLSTGLEYIPNRYADTEEVIALVDVVAEYGGVYATHQRNESTRVPESVAETIRIAEETGVRADISHLKACGKTNWGSIEEAVRLIEDARARGVDITADMYPYNRTSVNPLIAIERNAGWSCFRLPNDLEPFAEIRTQLNELDRDDEESVALRERYIAELAKALEDPSKREAIRNSVENGTPEDPSGVSRVGWDSYAVVVAEKNAHLVGSILSDVAEEQNRTPFDVAAELVVDEPDMSLSSGALSDDDMQLLMKQNWLMFSSDGGASPVVEESDPPVPGHPRAFGSQARVARKFVREDGLLTLEDAVQKMTSLPARFLQLRNRGLLLEGFRADIAVFDPERILDEATFADSRRYATGVEYVILNGNLSVSEGEYDGALHGRLLLLTDQLSRD